MTGRPETPAVFMTKEREALVHARCRICGRKLRTRPELGYCGVRKECRRWRRHAAQGRP